MIWSIEDPTRSRAERNALEALVSRVDWLVPGEWRIDSSLRVIWDADILAGDRTFRISLRYPNHFPHSPPLVLPRDQDELWSAHQYGVGGELCLEYGPDNWHPDLTGANMVESAYRLLAGERPAPDKTARVVSRHSTTLGQDLRGDRIRFLCTRELMLALSGLSNDAICAGKLVSMFHYRSFGYAMQSMELPDGRTWVDTTIPPTIGHEGVELDIAVIRWPSDVALPALKTRTELIDALKERGINLPDVPKALLIKDDHVRVYLLWPEDDTLSAVSTIPAQSFAARLDESHAALMGRTVAIIGCGSLGSKLAIMLARSGVGTFLLVDDDIMLPDNLIRHELDWREMGNHKAEALARRIELVNPSAKCETRVYRLGGQHSSGSVEAIIDTLASYDLIIDATADARVFNYLCAAIAVGKKSLLWAQVFGGGYAGLIARHRSGIEPAPATMRAQIEQWCIDQGIPVERDEVGYETRGDGPPMIADDADVSAIAAHAARLAIDTLIPRTPSWFPYSAYMIGLARHWAFEEPFDTRPIDVGTIEVDASQPTDPTLVAEETARLVQLLKKFSDETAAKTTHPPTATA